MDITKFNAKTYSNVKKSEMNLFKKRCFIVFLPKYQIIAFKTLEESGKTREKTLRNICITDRSINRNPSGDSARRARKKSGEFTAAYAI